MLYLSHLNEEGTSESVGPLQNAKAQHMGSAFLVFPPFENVYADLCFETL